MESVKLEKVQLEDVLRTLKEDGLDPSATADACLCYLWCLYQRSEGRLCSATQDLEELRQQQAEEMREVEHYVDHIRKLTEEREVLTSEFEKENEQLKTELDQLRLLYGAQLKEVEEMLDQEGLAEIVHSSPNEQIAYLLVERATLLEKLEQSEQKPDCHLGSLHETQLQDELEQSQQTLEELQQHRESVHQTTKETVNKNPWKKLFRLNKTADHMSAESAAQDEEFVKEKKLREFVERDLDEAAQRLQMAHDEIRRLSDELDMKKKEQQHALDSKELQKAKEHNIRLDKEILALRTRVRSLDSERKEYLELVEKLNKSNDEYRKKEKQQHVRLRVDEPIVRHSEPLQNETRIEENSTDPSRQRMSHNDENAHKMCQTVITERECRNNELLHKLQKLQREYEELVERNEVLESVLGETQNQRKEEREYFECETDGLQRKIVRLELELSTLQMSKEKPSTKDQGVSTETTKMQDFQQMFRNREEAIEILESRLSEEREWRQQLESDLGAAQKALREAKQIAELSQESDDLEQFITEQQRSREVHNETPIASRSQCKNLSTNTEALEDIIGSLEKEKEQLSVSFSESKKKLDTLQRQIYEGMVEKEKLFQENVQLWQDINNTRHELKMKKEEAVQLKQDLTNLQNKLPKPLSSGDTTDGAFLPCQPGEALLQQQQEEMRQLRQDLHRAQNLCVAAEKEMRHERERNLDLQKCSNLLQQENTKIKDELKQVQHKLSELSKLCSSLEAELEQSRQKTKELELNILKQQQASKTQNSLQDKLALAKSKSFDADRKIGELEQQLKDSHHQLRLTEARILQEKRFEDEVKECRENEKKLRRQLEEEQLNRKLSAQNVEELQQQIKSFRDRVASLSKINTELQFRIQQQEAKLHALDEDQKTTFDEHLHYQNNNQKLSEQLASVQQEKERLHVEYDRVQKHLDDYIRKYNERQLRHKAKLSHAKEVHAQEIEQCNLHIKRLVSEVALIRSQTEKEQAWIRTATTENEALLQEKRRLLVLINEHEETDRNSKWIISSLQSKVRLMDEENKHLQESILQLTSQIGSLERILKNIQTLDLEELKSVVPSEFLLLTGNTLTLPNLSCAAVGLADCIGSLKAIQDTQCEEAADRQKPSFSFAQSQPSEMGYLNVTSPRTGAGLWSAK